MIRIRVHEKLTISTAATRLNISFKNHAFPFVLCYCLCWRLCSGAGQRGERADGLRRPTPVRRALESSRRVPGSQDRVDSGLLCATFKTPTRPRCVEAGAELPHVRPAPWCVPRAWRRRGPRGDVEEWRRRRSWGGRSVPERAALPLSRVSWGSDFSVHRLISSAPCDPSSSARAAGAQRGSGGQSRAHCAAARSRVSSWGDISGVPVSHTAQHCCWM